MEVLLEAKVEQPVGFVEDEHLERLVNVNVARAQQFNKSTWRRYQEVGAVSDKVAEVLRGRGGSSNEQLRHDGRHSVAGSLVFAFQVWQDLGGGRVEFEKGEEDCVNLSSELSRRRDDDCADMVLLGGLLQAQ